MMQVLTIAWTVFCAILIISYPLMVFRKSVKQIRDSKEREALFSSNVVELLSFDIRDQFPGWSLSLDVPQIDEEILFNNPILFYLESEESCVKLPFNNATIGYTANIYKNIGKVYVTFKSLNDGVSNFYVPSSHLKKLKILIIKSKDARIRGDWNALPNKSLIYKGLREARVNINNYEDVLEYLSNISYIDFKGHFITQNREPICNDHTPYIKSKNSELSTINALESKLEIGSSVF